LRSHEHSGTELVRFDVSDEVLEHVVGLEGATVVSYRKTQSLYEKI